MKVNNKSVSVAALISATLAVAAIAPQAAIAAPKKAAKAPSARTMERQIQTEKRAISKEDARISNLENELTDLRSQLSAQKAADADVAAKQSQLESQFAAEAAKENAKNNLVFFRGGFAQTAQGQNVNAQQYSANSGRTLSGSYPSNNGWYAGAGFDFRVSDDFFGASDMVALDAELMLNYMNYGISQTGATTGLASGTVNQVQVVASPKIKFNLFEGKLRPWLQPAGLALNVDSLTLSGAGNTTVLVPAVMLGTGVEYNIWNNLWMGADFRYQFAGNATNVNYVNSAGGTSTATLPTGGLMTGAYIGAGF
jgi:hypothetical protein